jgi:hypothetical protein
MEKWGIVISTSVNDDLSWCAHLNRAWLIVGHFQTQYFFNQLSISDRQPSNVDLSEQGQQMDLAIHIRLGDYLMSSNPQGVLPISYYDQAIRDLKFQGSEKIAVVSDDIESAKLLMTKNFPGYYFLYSQTGPSEDLSIMIRAKNLICANSSLSLMAALLSPERGSTYVPEPFYKRMDFKLSAFPNNWKRLNVKDY